MATPTNSANFPGASKWAKQNERQGVDGKIPGLLAFFSTLFPHPILRYSVGSPYPLQKLIANACFAIIQYKEDVKDVGESTRSLETLNAAAA
jgi:hypothetical protein